MALAMKVAPPSIFSNYPSTSPKLHSFTKPLSSLKSCISISPPALKFSPYNLPVLSPFKKSRFQLHAAVESATVEEQEVGNSLKTSSRRKLFVLNLPWSFSVDDIKKLFGECGAVSDVEIIKHKDGKNRGFAFVTMASGQEAEAAIEKFDSYEIVGRIIRVDFAKRFKKPARTIPPSPPPREARYKLYVSNLAWKVRSNNLRDFFSSNFKPVSARVIFDNPTGRSAGYGFVSFATKEEAESAISALDGKELLGRPISLKFSEKSPNGSAGKDELTPDASESGEESNSDTSESKEESSEEQARSS